MVPLFLRPETCGLQHKVGRRLSRLHNVSSRTLNRRPLCLGGPAGAPAEAYESPLILVSESPTMLRYQLVSRRPGNTAPVEDFIKKVQMAWRIFFPVKLRSVTPKEDCKSRLRMILVADRCGISPSSMSEMKKTIVRALEHYVDIESEERVEVAISSEPEIGTIYSVAVPITRIKPEVRGKLEGDQAVDGIQVEWEDFDSDPSARFPYGC